MSCICRVPNYWRTPVVTSRTVIKCSPVWRPQCLFICWRDQQTLYYCLTGYKRDFLKCKPPLSPSLFHPLPFPFKNKRKKNKLLILKGDTNVVTSETWQFVKTLSNIVLFIWTLSQFFWENLNVFSGRCFSSVTCITVLFLIDRLCTCKSLTLKRIVEFNRNCIRILKESSESETSAGSYSVILYQFKLLFFYKKIFGGKRRLQSWNLKEKHF